MSQIFISYSRKDADFANDLAMRLRHRNFRVWMDKTDIKSGSNWQEVIKQSIHTSDVLLVILSPDSVVSEWVDIEYQTALDAGITVIPYVYRDVELPARLKNKNAIFYSDEAAFNKLIHDLPASVHVHNTSAVNAIGDPEKTFAEVGATVENCLRLFVMVDDKRIDLVGLPLQATRYCMSYLIGLADDTLEWQPRVQLAIQVFQQYPGDNFPSDIAQYFLQQNPDARLRVLLVRGPLKMNYFKNEYSASYGLDVVDPNEWEDVTRAVQTALNIYHKGTQRPDLQIFMLGPGVLLYELGTEHRNYYRSELYQYDPNTRAYYRVLGEL